jgi:hypothetical protein
VVLAAHRVPAVLSASVLVVPVAAYNWVLAAAYRLLLLAVYRLVPLAFAVWVAWVAYTSALVMAALPQGSS